MRVALGWLGGLILAPVLAASAPAAESLTEALTGSLKVGDPVPDVALLGAGEMELRTTDFKGQRELVLAWFPLAFTPG